MIKIKIRKMRKKNTINLSYFSFSSGREFKAESYVLYRIMKTSLYTDTTLIVLVLNTKGEQYPLKIARGALKKVVAAV